MKNGKSYQYEAKIEKAGETGGAYVPFPYDIRTEFGKGRVKVHATFDGEPYYGSIVNMRGETGGRKHLLYHRDTEGDSC